MSSHDLPGAHQQRCSFEFGVTGIAETIGTLVFLDRRDGAASSAAL